MKVPLYLALALLTWKLSSAEVNLLSAPICIAIYLGLAALYLFDSWKTWDVNKEIFSHPVPEIHRYAFKQVATLNVMYFATFGSELAVVSMLPLFFAETFQLNPIVAGMVASGYAFMNLVSRPSGGYFSDKFGRKRSLIYLTIGLIGGYSLMAFIGPQWPLLLAVAATMVCSFFVQAGEGAVFATVPLIKRRLTGQIAGMTGAYGNVGGVFFLTLLSMLSYQAFFFCLAATALLCLLVLFFMDEPEGHMAEVMADGSIAMIDVA